jgi:O-antigen ligase
VVSRLWGIGGLLFLAPLLLVREEKDFRHFVSTFLVWAVVLAVAMFGRLDGRAAGEKTELGLIAAGWLMGMAILLALYYRLLERRLPQFLVTLLCLPLLMIGLLASASRGPILSLVPAVVLTTLLNARQQLASRIVKLLGVLALFLLSYAAFSSFVQEMPEAREKFATKTAELARLWGGEMTAGSGGQRLPLYESALQGMSERPFFGLGVGGWSVYHYGRDQVDDPHSLFLQVGAEEGVVGLIALIAFLGTVGAAVRRILAATASRFLVLPGLLLFVVSTSMFSGNIDDDRLLWIWCGMTLAIARMVREWQLLHSPVASQPGQTLGLDSGGRVVS